MAAMAAASDDLVYAEPTKGMPAMRMRILRAELLSVGSLAVYNAVDNGEEVSISAGTEPRPRTTSTGALLSVSVSAEQNNTYARSIKESGWAFFFPWRFYTPFASYCTPCPFVAPTTWSTIVGDQCKCRCATCCG